MKKTAELIKDNLKAVDAVLEVIDARIPLSGRSALIDKLVGSGKKRIAVLNKKDLANPEETATWLIRLEKKGIKAIAADSNKGEGSAELVKFFSALRDEKNEGRERKRPYRIMVVGIPNAGKSSLINRLTKSAGAKTGGKPGVTRGKQWLNLSEGIMLMDTPGILQPKLGGNAGRNLAFCGSVKDETTDIAALGLELIAVLSELYPELLRARYKLERISETPLETMEKIAEKRGFVLSGNRTDYERTARTVLDEFRSGRIGRISLEKA